ncbi:unnamed protein product [Allacma fusca]|uniref:Nose resistant-to-fluoxetine protein N-terminal domain-containing protein n=1 Tax=Allacma fusca TaxID=39272 RepID=A0A8J2PCL5_9HEXA|nr:unnamed protein product [Allacma fusca]
MLSNSLIFFVVIGILTTFSFVHSRETPQEFLSADFHSFTHLKKLDTNKLGEDLHRKQTILSASRLRQDTVFAELYKDGSRLSEEFYKILLQNVTVDCADQFKHYLEAFSALPKIPDTWVLQMLDSWGKLPSGILSGNTAAGMLGDFHECVQLKGKYESKDNTGEVNVKGKYCHTVLLPGPALMDLKGGNNTESVLATLDLDLKNSASWEELIIHFLSNRWPQVVPMMGTCFPAACSSDDAQQILTSFHTHVLKNLVTQVVANCQTDEKPPLDAGRCAMIVILSLIALVCITGTFIDVYGTEAVKLRPGMNAILLSLLQLSLCGIIGIFRV